MENKKLSETLSYEKKSVYELAEKSTIAAATEYAEGHIPGTHFNIDVLKEGFEKEALKVLGKGKKIALYCRSGNRSKNAARILSEKGFQVVELSTGFKGWKAAGKPSEVTE